MYAGSFWPPACAGLSGEDLVDVELRPLTCPGALLVLARDQLADQAEGEELQAHDDEEHPEDQQRALSDCVAVDLERCQVSEHRDAENSEQQAEPAEQMKRPVAVPTDEGDSQQVEEASEVALDAVSRAPRATSSSRSTPIFRTTLRRSRACWRSWTKASTWSQAGRRTAATRSAGASLRRSSTG